MKNLLVAFFVFIAWEGHLCVEAQPFQQNRNLLSSVYNTTIAWSNFFDQFPKLWNSITTSLTQVGSRLVILLIGEGQLVFVETGFHSGTQRLRKSNSDVDAKRIC
jgi:hypothetical protein